MHVGPLLEEIARDHLVAVLLVRLGGYAVGMLEGERIVTSKVGSRFVKNRHKKGGSSANRFRRRREEQAKALIEEAAEVTASVLSPAPFVALGGDEAAVEGVLAARADLGVVARAGSAALLHRRGAAAADAAGAAVRPLRGRGAGRNSRTWFKERPFEGPTVGVGARERHPPRRGVLRRRLRDRDHAARARPDACPSSRAGSCCTISLHLWGAYIAYVSSFLYIGVIWLNHHNAFTRIHRIDRNLQWANLGLLFTTALLPFPTAVLSSALQSGGTADRRTAVVLYALSPARWPPRGSGSSTASRSIRS